MKWFKKKREFLVTIVEKDARYGRDNYYQMTCKPDETVEASIFSKQIDRRFSVRVQEIKPTKEHKSE